MRPIISDALFAILLAVALIWSCSKSEIITREEKEPEPYYPRTKADSTNASDSVPITFSVEVEGWKEIVINP